MDGSFSGMKRLDSSSTPSDEPSCSSSRELFRSCSQWVAQASGSPWTFLIAASIVIAWAIAGPFLHFADVWQLVINTVSSIVTFLMVFLIQNTQNRDTKAIHLKLDELLRGVQGARTNLVNLESLSDEDLDRLQQEFERLRRRANKSEPGKD
jgi:low affinity Fe/Cu permease